MGKLIPVGMQEALPGDTFQLSTSALIRVSPLAAPVMHPVNVRIHHFFVPHRLVWDEWEDFITGGPDGRNASTPPTASINVGADVKGTLWDYLGLPVNTQGTPGAISVSKLPIRGINMIWNEFYRDQDLQTERLEDDTTVPNIAWGKDYFTAARPWTQKGAEVTLPLGTQAPVRTVANGVVSGPHSGISFLAVNGNLAPANNALALDSTGTAGVSGNNSTPGTQIYPNNLIADLSAAGQVSINDFRRAFAIQRYQEARSRYGSRYTEYLRYLGVTPSDARLQRPEYLGGGTSRLNFSEVLQTAGDIPVDSNRETFGVGDLYGHGVSGLRHGRIRRFIEEHGYIHSFMSVRPKGIYMNGTHRTFLRRTKEDFFQRELAHIGQQGILQQEIMTGYSSSDAIFGYQDRYSEYKETPSLVAGEFRDILNYWHMARDLPNGTQLNEDFVKCVPTKRIHNVQTTNALWVMVNNNVVARRMVPKGGSSFIL